MVERILNLLNERNISEYRLIKDCGLPNSSITQWKQGKAQPGLPAVIKIAKYLDVSTDYLLGLDDNKTKNINTNTNNNQSNATGGQSTNNINLGNFSPNDILNNKIVDDLPEFKDLWAAAKDIADANLPAHRPAILHSRFQDIMDMYKEVATGKKRKKRR